MLFIIACQNPKIYYVTSKIYYPPYYKSTEVNEQFMEQYYTLVVCIPPCQDCHEIKVSEWEYRQRRIGSPYIK